MVDLSPATHWLSLQSVFIHPGQHNANNLQKSSTQAQSFNDAYNSKDGNV